MPCETLVITEIYSSVQGESSFAGFPCTFIRLTGCPLRCRWCDTAYAFEGGEPKTLTEILAEVDRLGVRLVEVTGGEPLAQPASAALIRSLHEAGYQVLIETSGSEPVDAILPYAHIITDIKCPGSKMDDRNHWPNLRVLKPTDEIKFVVSDRHDFDWACDMIKEHNLNHKQVLLSCAFGLLKPDVLVKWMLEARLACRLNLQQHKYIWSPRAKGV